VIERKNATCAQKKNKRKKGNLLLQKTELKATLKKDRQPNSRGKTKDQMK